MYSVPLRLARPGCTAAAGASCQQCMCICHTVYTRIGGFQWLGLLARIADERLPKRVLFGHIDGSGVRSQEEWVANVREESRKTYRLRGFHSHDGGNA